MMKTPPIAVLAVALALTASSARAALAIVSPHAGETVPLLDSMQAAFVAATPAERSKMMADAAFRRELQRGGGKAQPVVVAWTDDLPTGVYELAVRPLAPGAKTDRFTVTNVTEVALVNFEVGREYGLAIRRADDPGSAVKVTFKTPAVPRLMTIPRVDNFRDLGGAMSIAGKRVRQGLLYRSGAFNDPSSHKGGLIGGQYQVGARRITAAGVAELVGRCGVKSDLDLRNDKEVAGLAGSPLGGSVKYLHCPLRAYEWVRNDPATLKAALSFAMDAANRPLVFHCSGGRDRAGTLAYLLEGLLGVPEAALDADWAYSAMDVAELSFSESLLASLKEMLSHYPGETVNARIVAFVKTCGVTDAQIAAFRRAMLEE